jgi:hypothetical protein
MRNKNEGGDVDFDAHKQIIKSKAGHVKYFTEQEACPSIVQSIDLKFTAVELTRLALDQTLRREASPSEN